MQNKLKYFLQDNFSELNFNEIWVAGGAISSLLRDETPSDFDIYSSSPQTLIDHLTNKLHPGKETPNSVIFFPDNSPPIQIITTPFNNIEELVRDIDLTICAAAVAITGDFYCHENFWEHIATKKMGIQNSDFAENTFLRVLKYTRRGYTLPKEKLVGLIEKINPEVLRNATGNS